MTEYTDEEVARAIHAAAHARMDSIDINHDTSQAPHQIHVSLLNDLRAILKHLPDHQGGWQKCTWGDILHTDKRVKAEYASGTVIEGVPDGISDYGIYLVDGKFVPFSTHVRWYRIPAPVQHPDPERHPAIHVEECDIVGFIPKIMVWYRDSYVAGQQHLPPERITGWQQIDPAKVVADND